MTESPAVAIFLNRIARELERLRNQTAIIADTSDRDLSSVLKVLSAAIKETRKQAEKLG
jgi:hypothetical protein